MWWVTSPTPGAAQRNFLPRQNDRENRSSIWERNRFTDTPLNANHPQHVKQEGHPLPFSMLRAIRRDVYRQFVAAVKPLDITLHLHHLLPRFARSSSGGLTCQTELSSLTIRPSSCNARNTLKTCTLEHPVCRTTLFCLPRNKSEDLYK